MPLCQPQPTWATLWRERTCGSCKQIAYKLAYVGRKSGTYYWICPTCDFPEREKKDAPSSG